MTVKGVVNASNRSVVLGRAITAIDDDRLTKSHPNLIEEVVKLVPNDVRVRAFFSVR